MQKMYRDMNSDLHMLNSGGDTVSSTTEENNIESNKFIENEHIV